MKEFSKLFFRFYLVAVSILLFLGVYFDITPKETIYKSYERISSFIFYNDIESVSEKKNFPEENIGLYKLIDGPEKSAITRKELLALYKIELYNDSLPLEFDTFSEKRGVRIWEGSFTSTSKSFGGQARKVDGASKELLK